MSSNGNLKSCRNTGHPIRKSKQHIVSWKYDTRIAWHLEGVSPATIPCRSESNAPLVSIDCVSRRSISNDAPGWTCDIGGSCECRAHGKFGGGYSADYWTSGKGTVGVE
jgi:hypothetical protein